MTRLAEPSNPAISQALQRCQRTFTSYRYACMATTFAQAILLAFLLQSLWGYCLSPSWQAHGLLMFISTSAFLIFLKEPLNIKQHLASPEKLLLALELRFAHAHYPPWGVDASTAPASKQEWQLHIEYFCQEVANRQQQKLLRQLVSVFCLLALSSLTLLSEKTPLIHAWQAFAQQLLMPQPQANILVLRGSPSTHHQQQYALSPGQPPNIELTSPNLVEVTARGFVQNRHPLIILRQSDRNHKQQLFQSFKMLSFSKSANDDIQTEQAYRMTFAISQDVFLTIPEHFGDKPLAYFTIKKLPLPHVSLSASQADFSLPWPDEKPLVLNIEATTTAPLKNISLIIRIGNRESREIVQTLTSETVHHYANEYSLLLEPYINSDLAEVEILAEAIDAAVPLPLTGQSQPLRIRTESAYGRYRHSLVLLRQMKDLIDQALESQSPTLPSQTQALAQEVSQRAAQSPFFDALDRQILEQIDLTIRELEAEPHDYVAIDALSHKLNTFLVEHEILDDRERDRDFFVATRALSHLLEQAPETRPISVEKASKNLLDFLKQRKQRWRIRINHLADSKGLAQKWSKIKEGRMFSPAFNTIIKHLQTPKGEQKALAVLAKTVADYRLWLDDLERQEELERQKREAARQEGLVSAQEQLRELQRQQGKVSAPLDQSVQKSMPSLSDQWPMIRLQQNSVIKEAQKLEYQLRALAPQAGARLKAAIQAMHLTLETGEKQNYIKAESFADLAGRLLRKAEKDSHEAGRQQNRRKRKHVAGDGYYGQSIHGGDLEISREYRVDKKYREDILDAVLEAQGDNTGDKEDNLLLENYLRRIIR